MESTHALTALVAFLDKWQTLAGSLIGAAAAVAVALIVSERVPRRDRYIAAVALLPDLQILRAANDDTKKRAEAARWLVLNGRLPTMPVLHSTEAHQLNDIDDRLSAHLSLLKINHREVEKQLPLFAQYENQARAPGSPTDKLVANALAEDISARLQDAWRVTTEHAEMAEYFLDRFIFCPWWRPPSFSRIRMRMLPNDYDRRSTHLLKTGSVFSAEKPTAELKENTPI
ncbi:hypothetical protein PQR14_11690 [Paraburkholderia bryophila]|uniref:hypothetical protein n=1 Tax=Paraburkholderia bryophila TaxID=420952 RepID=UPI0038BAD94E